MAVITANWRLIGLAAATLQQTTIGNYTGYSILYRETLKGSGNMCCDLQKWCSYSIDEGDEKQFALEKKGIPFFVISEFRQCKQSDVKLGTLFRSCFFKAT